MTPRQIINKIDDLEFWLINNPDHPNYQTVLKDKLSLKKQLKPENQAYE